MSYFFCKCGCPRYTPVYWHPPYVDPDKFHVCKKLFGEAFDERDTVQNQGH